MLNGVKPVLSVTGGGRMRRPEAHQGRLVVSPGQTLSLDWMIGNDSGQAGQAFLVLRTLPKASIGYPGADQPGTVFDIPPLSGTSFDDITGDVVPGFNITVDWVHDLPPNPGDSYFVVAELWAPVIEGDPNTGFVDSHQFTVESIDDTPSGPLIFAIGDPAIAVTG